MARKTGPKPKPAPLKLLAGNPGHREIPTEPKPSMGERAPKAPTWLPPEAQLIWRKEARIFYAAGILTHADLNTFALYCEACARYRKAAMLLYKAPSFMIRTPNGSLQHHPYLSILRAAYKDVLAIAAEFGGTPSARSRIDAHESAFPDSDTDKEMFGE